MQVSAECFGKDVRPCGVNGREMEESGDWRSERPGSLEELKDWSS